jgi:hypothetical protein
MLCLQSQKGQTFSLIKLEGAKTVVKCTENGYIKHTYMYTSNKTMFYYNYN